MNTVHQYEENNITFNGTFRGKKMEEAAPPPLCIHVHLPVHSCDSQY